MSRLRPFGHTGLEVPPLGLGGGPLGDGALPERDAHALIDRALELGVTLIDTAPSYGDSEHRIGRALRGRRDAVVLSTKVGYGVPGHADWTGPCITAGIDRALAILGTDVLDIVHLHSCGRDVIERGDVVRALDDGVRAGKVRVAAYAGEEDALDAALATGVFGAVQLSISPWDQRALHHRVPTLARRGLGVLGKRSLANAPWRFAERPSAPDLATYWDRFHRLGFDPHDLAWPELALRFGAYAPGVSAILMGTRSIARLEEAVAAVARGPLPAPLLASLHARFDEHGHDLHGVV